MRYKSEQVGSVIIAGKEYGTGSSRDWAAKGPFLLGVKAVLAESYERIHRSNLLGMGVLPLEFPKNVTWHSLKLDGTETIAIDLDDKLQAKQDITVTITHQNQETQTFQARCRIDTPQEVLYYKHGGILNYILRKSLKKA